MQDRKLRMATWLSYFCLLCASESDPPVTVWNAAWISICVNNIGTLYMSHLITEHGIPPGQSIAERLCIRITVAPQNGCMCISSDWNIQCAHVLMSVAMHVCDWVFTFTVWMYGCGQCSFIKPALNQLQGADIFAFTFPSQFVPWKK